jgi:hypothetical protein
MITLEELASRWSASHPAEVLGVTLGTAAVMVPHLVLPHTPVGLVPQTMKELLSLYGYGTGWVDYACGGLYLAASPVMAAKLYKERKAVRRLLGLGPGLKRRGVWLGSMWLPENCLWTHIKVTGMTGSGKSATVFIPFLQQLLETYCDEDMDRRSRNPYKKIGMAVLEVKGTFWEYLVYLTHSVGRNSSEDVVVFRPESRFALAHFQDEQDRHWYLNAMPHTWKVGETSSEAHQLYAHIRRANGLIYPATMFRESAPNRAAQEELRGIEVPVSKEIRFVGWRWDGPSHLVRVSHTPLRDSPQYWEPEGRKIRVDAPKTLRFVGMFYASNGLRTNLIKPNLPVAEVASRLKILAKLAKGGGNSDRQNDFFYDAAEKQIQNCIALHQAVHRNDGVECTAIDLVRLTTSDAHLDAYMKAVETITQEMKAQIEPEPDKETRQMRLDREYQPLVDLLSYFKNEWRKLQQGEGKVAHSVNGVITNAFQKFLTDPNLRDTYCSKQTVDYQAIYNEGKILCFVPGQEYEMSQRQLAVDFKMDVVSTGLMRKALGLEMSRPVCFVQDEGQEYIISHETVGDTKALSQLREFKTFYLLGTQSDSWVEAVIGLSQSKVYLQGFGTCVFLRQNDEATNKHASLLSAKIKVEDRMVDQKVSLPEVFIGGEFSASQKVGVKDRHFIEPEEFSFLKIGEGIVWRTGEDGQEEQVKKVQFPFHFVTSDEGHAAVGDRLRHYMREVVENTLHKRGEHDRIGHLGQPAAAAAKAATPAEAPAPATTPSRGAGTQELDFSSKGTAGGPAGGGGPAAEKKADEGIPLSPKLPFRRDSTPITITHVPATSTPQEKGAPGPSAAAPEAAPRVPDFRPIKIPGTDGEPRAAGPIAEPPPGSRRALEREVEEHSRHLVKMKTQLAQGIVEGVGSYKELLAEKAAQIGDVPQKEHLADSQLATGARGEVLGNPAIQAVAAPVRTVKAVAVDLSDIVALKADQAKCEAAIARAAREAVASSRETDDLSGIGEELFGLIREGAGPAGPEGGHP